MRDYTRHERRRWIVPLVMGAAAVIGLGGLWFAGRTQTPRAIAAKAVEARSPEEATAVVAAWLDFNDSRDELLDTEHRRATVERFVTRDDRARVARELDEAARQLEAGSDPPATVRSSPLGYRVLRFTPSRAVVETWELVIRGAPDAPPRVVSAHSRLTLLWQNGWRIADVSVAGARALLSTGELAAADQVFRSFRHVP